MNRTKVTAVALSLLVSSCATTVPYEKSLDSWLGASAESLVVKWGPPEASFPLPKGGMVLEYSSVRTMRIASYTTTEPRITDGSGAANAHEAGGLPHGNYSKAPTAYVQKTTPVQNIALKSLTRFTVDARGTITHWTWVTARPPAIEGAQEVP